MKSVKKVIRCYDESADVLNASALLRTIYKIPARVRKKIVVELRVLLVIDAAISLLADIHDFQRAIGMFQT